MREIESGADARPSSNDEAEPSNYALSVSEAIMNGEAIILYPEDISRLTQYERNVLSITAKRQRYHWRHDLDTGKITLEKDAEW
jgi:hypothetical protein